MPYFIYLRKSRADLDAEQHGEGETLARHEAALMALAHAKGLQITKIYKEVVSGETIASRPAVQQLLSDVESGQWDGVLVMEVERLARGDTIDQGLIAQTFKYSETKIITPVKTYDPNDEFDEEYFEFGLFMSRREYKAINRRMQRGRLASIKEGKYVGNIPPLGYRRKKLEHEKGWTLEINPEEAEIVRLIFDLYTTGLKQPDGSFERIGVSKIAHHLESLGIRPRKGGTWSIASVRDILINPVYIGKVRWNWRPAKKKMVDGQRVIERPRNNAESYTLVDGLHPALITQQVWDQAQFFMKQNAPRPIPARKKISNPLSGLIVCGKCGHKMVRRPYTNRDYPDTLICCNIGCDNVSSQLHIVETRVLKSLRDWLEQYKLQWNTEVKTQLTAQTDAKKKALKKLDQEIAAAQKQLDNIYDFLEQGIYTTEVFLDRSKKLNDTINRLKENYAVLEKEIKQDKAALYGQDELVPKVEHLLEVYDTLETPADKNAMLSEVIDKVIYTKEVRDRSKKTMDQFTLLLYPKVPKVDEQLLIT